MNTDNAAVVAQRRATHDDAAVEIVEHVIACTDGCTLHLAICPVGDQLAAVERATFDAYREVRFGPVEARP